MSMERQTLDGLSDEISKYQGELKSLEDQLTELGDEVIRNRNAAVGNPGMLGIIDSQVAEVAELKIKIAVVKGKLEILSQFVRVAQEHYGNEKG